MDGHGIALSSDFVLCGRFNNIIVFNSDYRGVSN